MATAMDLARRLIPDEPDDVLDVILWNHTALGFCSVLTLARHLNEWKKQRDAGLSNCALCGAGYKSDDGKIILGGECGQCWPPKKK